MDEQKETSSCLENGIIYPKEFNLSHTRRISL